MLTVFSSPTCGWCDKLKGYLREKRVDFREIDVSRSTENRLKLMSVSGQSGVPVTVSDKGEIVVGFDKSAIDELLQ